MAIAAAALLAGTGGLAPAAGVEPVRATTTVTPVAASSSSSVLDGDWGDDDTGEDEYASAATGSWRPELDLGSLYSITQQSGAQRAWTYNDPYGRDVTGRGVTVAVIDTGVAPVSGLDAPGKVINGPDLSFESQADGTRYLDGYGHGTHMAGIIAGRDTISSGDGDGDGGEGGEDGGAVSAFRGVAPDARVLNVKVGAADGGTDVTQVIAAIDWVVQHRNDNGMNVRVINLSYGTGSVQSYQLDPLAHAVENAWRHGIVVVAAAGNDGLGSEVLTMPAADPYVLAVGAVDHRGTPDPSDDVVADFTNGGNAERRPDLLAPGKSVVSLRVPGSHADQGHPEGLVTGDDTGRFFRGSGTSQAAAVVSGAVALLVQDRPRITPDQVKRLLLSTATPLPQNPHPAMGAGVLNLSRAIAASTPSAYGSRQTWPASTGLGTLEAARGGEHVVDPDNGAVLAGETDALGSPWDARRWSTASTAASAWTGGEWNARRWSGDSWSGSSWSGAAWAARRWSGLSWSGLDWNARRWSGDTWNARRWSGQDWQARRWSEAAWRARRWSGDTWGLAPLW